MRGKFVARKKLVIMHRLLVRDLAEKQGYNMSSLSRKADVNFNTVRAIWLKPNRDVSLAVLIKLAKALGVNVADLFMIEDE
jgi:transcriptional regulator with XRE-family HTH domain